MSHVIRESPDEPGRYLVCRQAHDGLLTAVEDCPTLRLAELRARAHDSGDTEVRLPVARPRRLIKGFYTDADAGG